MPKVDGSILGDFATTQVRATWGNPIKQHTHQLYQRLTVGHRVGHTRSITQHFDQRIDSTRYPFLRKNVFPFAGRGCSKVGIQEPSYLGLEFLVFEFLTMVLPS